MSWISQFPGASAVVMQVDLQASQRTAVTRGSAYVEAAAVAWLLTHLRTWCSMRGAQSRGEFGSALGWGGLAAKGASVHTWYIIYMYHSMYIRMCVCMRVRTMRRGFWAKKTQHVRRHGRLQGEENGSASAIRVGWTKKKDMDGLSLLDCHASEFLGTDGNCR
ncbi:hypothetical protein F4677DRAFT_409922 [Hypoxylon crocopeplum]|nr:hypothetical protein F4677DRAFT_409922 [Hypoxylon crocopeplum]